MRVVFLGFFLFLLLGSSLFVSCAGDKGELVGVRVKKWYSDKPYGMTLVKGGTFIMGKTNDDNAGISNSPTKQVAVTSFYMDETEITNGEYRQFVEWVRDSIVRTMLADKAEELEKDLKNDKKGIGQYAYISKDSTKMSAYEKYMLENYPDIAKKRLNTNVEILWSPSDYPDTDYASVMDSIYLPIDDAYDGVRIVDVKHLNFLFQWLDILEAANSELDNRKDFIKREEVNVYPDTLVWIKDFNYSYNEPLHNKYFSHSAYIDYPVVGVTWNQARAFSSWRTLMKNDYQKFAGNPFVNNFRLPTEAEWEYAARGGIESGKYPWGGPYIINDKACYLANFKPQRGDYASDDHLYTAEVMSYEPNGYNLYNMSGNVAEWTNSSYYANSYDFIAEINPNALRGEHKRRVIRGGSWKDVAYFLEVSTRDFEYSDSARSYIGFRTVQDYLGKE